MPNDWEGNAVQPHHFSRIPLHFLAFLQDCRWFFYDIHRIHLGIPTDAMKILDGCRCVSICSLTGILLHVRRILNCSLSRCLVILLQGVPITFHLSMDCTDAHIISFHSSIQILWCSSICIFFWEWGPSGFQWISANLHTGTTYNSHGV